MELETMNPTPSPVKPDELFNKLHQPSLGPAEISQDDLPDRETLTKETSVAELETLDNYLWMIGSENNISALHHQKVILREIIPTDLIRLHLIWFDRIIYIKPFPLYFFNHDFIHQTISDPQETSRASNPQSLRRDISGFLHSYCALVKSPLDLEIAHRSLLLPETLTWKQWSVYRRSILAASSTNDGRVQGRYRRGELRLSRLNLVYRVTGRGISYFTVHRQYDTYFRQFVALFLTVFALLATVLTAMQVMVGVSGVPRVVRDVCYGTAIAAVIFEAVCLVGFAVVFLVFFTWNSVRAWKAKKRARQSRQGLGRVKEEVYGDA